MSAELLDRPLPHESYNDYLDRISVVISDQGPMTGEQVRAALTVGGVKHDTGKLPYELLPSDAIEEILKVLAFGARKYAARNWELGMDWDRPFAALMRHMWAWFRKSDGGKDPETGLSHLAHAGCCLLFLLSYELRGVGKDTRP